MKQSKKGFALVSAIVITIVLFILTAGLITAAMMSMNITSKNIDQRQAYLNAKSALGFSESYYLSQLQLPDQPQYLAFAADNGSVSGGASVSAAKDASGNEVPPDAQTYVKAEYDMGAQSFTLTATARFHSQQLDGAQTLQLSCSYDVGYDADGRITTVVKKIETKDKSRYVTIHVKPYDDMFQPYLYTWGYATGQEEQQPVDTPYYPEWPNTKFSGEWLSSTKTDAQGNLLYAGPQGAMTRESAGSSGGWNGWYSTEIELRDDNVNYINAIIAKKGALRGDSNTTTQSHELFQLPVPENAGERQDVYITLNSEELHDFRWDTMTTQGGEAPDSFTEYLTSYVKAEYTTVHVRRAQPDGTTAKELTAPQLVMEAFEDENLMTATSETKPNFSGGEMIYEGCGWYRLNVPTQKAFSFSIEDEGRTVFQTSKDETGGVDHQIWVALPAQGTSNAPAVKTTEKEINTYFRDSLNESGAGDYSTVYVKGLALSREDVNDIPTVLMNYYAKGAEEDIPLPPSTGKYLLTLNYNDREGTVDKKTYSANEKIVLPTLSRTGYVFMGWATSSTKTQPDYKPGAEYTVKGNAYLYGVWEMTEYFVTYDANGGQNPPATQSFTVDAPAKFAGQGAMSNGSYSFMGWSRTKTGDAEFKPGDTIDPSIMGTGTKITLFAVWNDKYFITYDANGGTGTLPAKQGVNIGGSFTVGSGSLLFRENYEFLGWSTDKNASSAEFKAGQSVVPEKDMTLYAVWKKTSFTVYFRNEKNWTTVNAYVWKNGGAVYQSWPGEKMTDTGKMSEGFKLYSYEIPLGSGYNQIIFNNGSGEQTDDLTLDEKTPAYYYSSTTDRGTLVLTTEFRSVYFTDNKNWGAVNIYLWKGSVNNGWPGGVMEFASKNGYNQNIYSYCYPAGKYDTAIFSKNKSPRTVNVDISKDKDGKGYYLTDPDASSDGNYNVAEFDYKPSAKTNANASMVFAGSLTGGTGARSGFGTQSAGGGVFSRQSPFGIQNLFTAAAGWLQSFFAPPQLQNAQPAQAENTLQSLLASYGGAFYLRTAADVLEKQSNPDSVYLAGTFNGWAYDNDDYKMQAVDGSGFETFTFTATLPGGSSYKFNIFDDGVTYGKKGAVFSGEMAQNNALEAAGEEMSLQTIGTIKDRIDVAFTYERTPQADGSTKFVLKTEQKAAVSKEKINIYIGVAAGIVTTKGSDWKTPDVECKDKNGSVTNYVHSIALSSGTTTVKYGEGDGAFYMSSAQISSVTGGIRLSVNTTALAAGFLSNVKEDHLYLLYQSGGGYVLADNGEYSPTMDGLIDFDGDWTQEDVKIASDRGSKVQYYNTLMSKYKTTEIDPATQKEAIKPLSPKATSYGYETTRAGNSATCYLNDWYTYKIKTGQNGSYTVQFTGLNGKQNTYKDKDSTSIDKTALGPATATISSLRGDTWITLNTDSVKGGVMDDLSVYTYDPEENYAGKETTVYLDDKAGWGGKDHSGSVYVYYWGVKTMAWPGKEMKYDEKIGKYYATVPSSSPFLVFNNGLPMDDEDCKRSGIETLQSDWTLTCYDNEKGEWVSYVHPRVALYKAINDGVAALNRSTIQKNTNKNDGMVSFTVLQDLIVDARTAYDNYSFNEYSGYTDLLTSYVDGINAFNDVLREARIYLDGYPEHQYYDSSLSYSPESIANLNDAHNSAMAVFSLSSRSTAAGQIRSKTTLLRKAIDSMDLQLSGGGDMQAGQAVVVLVNQDEKWSHPGDKESGIGGGLVDFGTYTQTDDGILADEVIKKDEPLTQYNSQGYYLYFIDIPEGSNSAWAQFRSIYSGGGESSKKSGIKAGEVWVYNNKTKTWRENTAGDFQVVGTSTITGKKGDSRLFTAKKEKGDFKLYFSYDTKVNYDGAQYVIYAGVYQIKNDVFPDGIDLFTPQAKEFFTNPESFGFDVGLPTDENKFPVPVVSSVDCGWTDADGNLTAAPQSMVGTVNLLVGGKLGADSSGADPVTPEKANKRIYFYDKDGKWASGGEYKLNVYDTNGFNNAMVKSAVPGYYYYDLPANTDCRVGSFQFYAGNYAYTIDGSYRKISAGIDIDAVDALLFILGEKGVTYDELHYQGTWSVFDPSIDPRFALDKAEEETPGSSVTGADIDAAGQHNLITGNAGTLPANHKATYTAGKINFRWVQGNVLDMTGSEITLDSKETTVAVSDISVTKRLGSDIERDGKFLLGQKNLGVNQFVTFYTDVNVIIYNKNGTVDKQNSFTIKNGRYKISDQVDLFDFKMELERTDGNSKVASVDSARFSGRVFGHGD